MSVINYLCVRVCVKTKENKGKHKQEISKKTKIRSLKEEQEKKKKENKNNDIIFL